MPGSHGRFSRNTSVLVLSLALAAIAPPRTHAAEERSDAVLAAVKPQRLTILRGKASATRTVAVVVRNANQRTAPGVGSGPLDVQLSAVAVDCPAGTVVGTPDLDPRTAGSQPTATLAQGKSARAKVAVTLLAAEVSTPSRRAPQRCRVRVSAVVVAPAGNVDPRQTNDEVLFDLDVVDRNDDGPTPATDVVTLPVKPLRAMLPGAGATRDLTVSVKIQNAGATPVVATLDADDGDCPAGTVLSLDADARTAGDQSSASLAARQSGRAAVRLRVRPPLWATADGASPARCTLRVRSSAPVADDRPSNDEIAIALDTAVTDDATSGAGCPTYATPATVAGNPPSVLDELSGLAASRRHPGVFWAHNDSGNAFELYALDGDGTLLETFDLSGASAVDIEDVAVARCGPASTAWCIYLADIGDNGASRSQVSIYKLPEPDLTAGQTLAVEVLPFSYPGGPRDAESLVAEAVSGRLFVVSKLVSGLGQVFRLDGLGSPGGGSATSVVTFAASTPPDAIATAADAHPSGERVLLRTYGRVWELRRPGALLLEEVFAATPVVAVTAAQPQGEAIAYTDDGLGYLFGSEQLAPIREVGCAP